MNQPRTTTVFGSIKRAFKQFLEPKGRRKDHGSTVEPLATQLTQTGRKKQQVLANDLYHDSPLLRWMVDMHVKNCTRFVFQAKTGDPGLNRMLTDFYAYFCRTVDLSGRYDFHTLREHWERRKVLDGDVLLVKSIMKDSRIAQIQTVQSDWVQSEDKDGWVQGVRVDEYSRPTAYRIVRQTSQGQELKHTVEAKHAILNAWMDGRMDSYRGVSPLTPSLALFQDLLDIQECMAMKVKVDAALGLAITSTQENGSVGAFAAPKFPEDERLLAKIDENGRVHPNYPRQRKVDFAGGGLKSFALRANEDVKMIESKAPGATYVPYMESSVEMAMKCLWMPVTLLQESKSNYHSYRAAYALWQSALRENSCYNQWLYTEIFRWALLVAHSFDVIQLPAGKRVEELNFRFVQENHSVLDIDREMKGLGVAVQQGMMSPLEACNLLGRDFESVAKETAQAQAIAKACGVHFSVFVPEVATTGNFQMNEGV